MNKHRYWADIPEDELEHMSYGNHQFGIGVYRFNPSTHRKVEAWPDLQCVTKEELERYETWCKENNLRPYYEPSPKEKDSE